MLKGDKRAVFKAAAAAQKAADWMLALHPDYARALSGAEEARDASAAEPADAVVAEAA